LLVNELTPSQILVQANIEGLSDRKETRFIIPSSDLSIHEPVVAVHGHPEVFCHAEITNMNLNQWNLGSSLIFMGIFHKFG